MTMTEEQLAKLRQMHVTYRDPPSDRVKHYSKPTKNGSVQLDYIGHADLTDILLDEDPAWNWEPAGVEASGVPAVKTNANGWAVGLWIKLTVHGLTRYGYGSCDPRPDAEKVLIGNALRNAAMRFGIGLALWKANTLALLAHGLDPDDQGVVEGDDREESGDEEAVRDGLTHNGNGRAAPTAQAEAPAGTAEVPVRERLSKLMTAMAPAQAKAFAAEKRQRNWPGDLRQADDALLAEIVKWLESQPVARVTG